jgi:porin
VNTPGAFIRVEVGYQTTYANVQYPAKYNIGFYEDTASASKPTSGYWARNAFWAQFQQAVWRPDRNSTQSLHVFGGALVYSGHSPQWGQYYLGLFAQGPFASRPRDTIGFIGSLYLNNSAIKPNKPTQTMWELNYGFSAIPGVTIKPLYPVCHRADRWTCRAWGQGAEGCVADWRPGGDQLCPGSGMAAVHPALTWG